MDSLVFHNETHLHHSAALQTGEVTPRMLPWVQQHARTRRKVRNTRATSQLCRKNATTQEERLIVSIGEPEGKETAGFSLSKRTSKLLLAIE